MQPGTYVGSAFGDTFAPAPVQRTFDTGCIKLSSASGSHKCLKSSRLPLKLYLYWEQGWESAPVVVQQCAQKAADILEAMPWAVELKDEETVQELLLPTDLHFYNKVRECCEPTMKADLIRLMILHRHGGVWCDASNVLTDDLAWLSHFFDEPDVQLFAFTSPHQDEVFVKGCQVPLLETWFMACVPECRFIGEWLSQFKCALLHRLTTGSLTDYMKRITTARACTEDGVVSLHRIPKTLREYLLVHVTHQFVLQTSDIPIEDWKIKTLPSCDGPFLLHCRYTNESGWDTNKMITTILKIDEDAQNRLETPPYFIKLRGDDRQELERHNEQGQGDGMNWLMSCRFHA